MIVVSCVQAVQRPGVESKEAVEVVSADLEQVQTHEPRERCDPPRRLQVLAGAHTGRRCVRRPVAGVFMEGGATDTSSSTSSIAPATAIASTTVTAADTVAVAAVVRLAVQIAQRVDLARHTPARDAGVNELALNQEKEKVLHRQQHRAARDVRVQERVVVDRRAHGGVEEARVVEGAAQHGQEGRQAHEVGQARVRKEMQKRGFAGILVTNQETRERCSVNGELGGPERTEIKLLERWSS